MTATATPGRDELRSQIAQALCCQGDCIRGADACWKYTTSGHKKITDAIVAIFDRLAAKPADEGVRVWLREVGSGTDNACWVVCNRVDPGAVDFSSTTGEPKR